MHDFGKRYFEVRFEFCKTVAELQQGDLGQ
jgi:hypothetical protein